MTLVLIFGCAVPLAASAHEPLVPAMPIAAPSAPAAPGSLWSDTASRALVGLDNNARAVGDQVTVKVAQSTDATNGADTNLARDGASDFGVTALLGAETSILSANSNMGGKIGLGGSSSSSTKGTGATSRRNNVSAVVTCIVDQVYPNGSLHITGTSTTKVNNETQVVYVRGIARARDIRLDNSIDFSLLADSTVEVSGNGAVTNQQGQGWGNTIANAIWPF